MENLKLTCEFCQFWTVVGKTDSGLRYPSGEPWLYAVGECSCEQSPHFFNDEKRKLAEQPRFAGLMRQPSWGDCYMYKARRGA